MKKIISLSLLLLLAGCTQKEASIGLEVPIKTSGCAGFEKSFSDVKVNSEGLNIVSNVISPHPCYYLEKAEVSRTDDKVTVYFTFNEEMGNCRDCIGVQSMIYRVFGDDLNRSGINIKVIADFEGEEDKHSFTS